MSKHTSGPWSFMAVIMAKDDIPIAQIIEDAGWPNGEVEANARLISAAPEMLDALKKMRPWCCPDESARDCEITLMQIDDIIAKAEGKS